MRRSSGLNLARAGALVLLSAMSSPSHAVMPDEMLGDPGLEARARRLSTELRCVVCQNQSIDDSNAPLAHDLRVLLRERLSAGDTDRQAIDYLVARYGNFVLLKPPMQLNTLLLWIGPLLILVAAAIGLGRHIGRSATRGGAPQPPAPLDAKEQERLDALLSERSSA
jgi:cytochrome c-type biogenesis protein CcmH